MDVEEDVQEIDVQEEDNTQESQSTVLKRVIYLLYFLLWATLYMIALEYEFGAVYFVLSALIFICLNTRSGPKRRGEPSAYSVFNPNCEAIEGTLDASQFEKEIRYGIGGIRWNWHKSEKSEQIWYDVIRIPIYLYAMIGLFNVEMSM